MVVLRALNQTQCISSIQAEVMVLAAKTIYETALKPTDGITDLASAVAAIADLLPQATTFADRLPQEYSDIIKECVLFMTPRDKPQQANNTTAQATTNTIVVESAAERELRDKYVVVGGMRLWRNAEAPWSIFYAHMWIGKRFHEWKSAWDNFTAGSTAPDTIIHRQKCTEHCGTLVRGNRHHHTRRGPLGTPGAFIPDSHGAARRGLSCVAWASKDTSPRPPLISPHH